MSIKCRARKLLYVDPDFFDEEGQERTWSSTESVQTNKVPYVYLHILYTI